MVFSQISARGLEQTSVAVLRAPLVQLLLPAVRKTNTKIKRRVAYFIASCAEVSAEERRFAVLMIALISLFLLEFNAINAEI